MDPAPEQSPGRSRRIAALVLLGLGVLALILANVSHDGSMSPDRGWSIWVYAYEELRDGDLADDVEEALGFSSFFTLHLLVLVAPAATEPLRRSRVLRSLSASLLLLASGVMGYFFLDEDADNPVLLFLMLAPLLSFIGVLVLPSAPRPGVDSFATGAR